MGVSHYGREKAAPGQDLAAIVVLDLEIEVVLFVLGHELAGRHIHADLHLALVPGRLQRQLHVTHLDKLSWQTGALLYQLRRYAL